ncbi:MFS family permease [Altererythrobacter atlanticus]|uniref:MFS-type transporter YhjX n=1 Tax=Croceibacterium atlanticum TaxID=1267766 RepID=A0A0F7KKM1_9SPHN|nr:MFS transporter [Croceibacterium atlanticum]AKH41128.1 putative MFS-type transporter YhjX [Croceibacterium atlanticum]MBB5732644.1 MFS family permease [Croceibacterium atlanticum]
MNAMAASRRDKLGILIAATTGSALATTATVHAVFGTFLVPLSESFGWSRASISLVLAILALTGAIVYPLAGRYADRHGTRRMILAGNALLALSVGALALTSGSLFQFYLTYLAIGIFGALPATAIFSKLVAEWFDENRGTALGVTAGLGNGLGAVLIPILAAVLVSREGWRAGYVGIAAVILLVGFPIFFFLLKDAPGSAGKETGSGTRAIEGLSLAEAVRLPIFWLIMIAIAAGGGISTAVLSHVVPILGDRGFSLATGTAVVSIFALVGSIWQIATGRILDRTKGPQVVVPMYGLAILGLLLLEFGQSTMLLLIGGVCLGIALGSQFGSLPFFIARYFGLKNFGTIIGVMYSGVIAAQGITPVLLDLAYDSQGTYRGAIYVCIAVMALGSLLLFLLPAYRMDPALPETAGVAAH